MKAIVIRQFGDPSVLNLEDVSQPTLEAGEIAIKVRAVTVNQTLDVALRAGKYARRPPLPHVLGSDAAGEVAAVAADVKTLKVGDRVVCHPIVGRQPTGALKLLGVDTWGTYADFVKVPANTVQIVPDALDFITAAVVGRHGPLAFTQLRDRAQVKPGEWVLVMGAAGGLGSTLVQAAKHLGARVIAAAGSDERVAAAVQLGADHGINYRSQDLTAEARRITHGAGVNAVLDNIGDPVTFPKALASLGFQGRLVTAGGHGGGNVPLDVKYLYLNVITIFGNPIDTPDNFKLALKLAAEGKLKVLIDEVLPLKDARRAHEMVEQRSGIGKVVLTP
ncbi:MAG TPA: zinc-binding dehydrogenase [Xanthobacteraceae bacterium]|nr:zinc-binding dehydrogenase [Xanthobacteraceae bacterium]